MLKSILLLLLLVTVISVQAQKQYQVTGVIIEKKMKIEFASIVLFKDSTKVYRSQISDSTGSFTLNEIAAGNYKLSINLIGYLTKTIALSIGGEKIVTDLGVIEMQADKAMLKQVEVSSQRKLIRKTPGGFIFSAKDNITQAGGTATDLLKNTPTVVVDIEGGITLRGKTPMILINGRNSTLSSTDRIPASSIESIEIINNPSAKYDADAEGGIINIKLKKNESNGTNGSIGLGTGMGAEGRYNSALLINHQQGKWNLGIAYDNRFAGRTRHADAARTNFNLPDQYLLSQFRNDQRYEQTQNAKLNLDYTANKNNRFSLELVGNLEGQDNKETLVSRMDKSNKTFNYQNSRFSNEIAREKAFEYAAEYLHSFSDKRKTLKASFSSGHNNDKENTDINTQSLNADYSVLGTAFLQRTHTYEDALIQNYKLDFSSPAGNTGTIEAGYKGTNRRTDNDFQSLNLVGSTYIPNAKASNIFHFSEQVHAAYFQYKNKTGKADTVKWQYELGLRAEQVTNEGNAVTNQINVKNNYLKLFPSANIAYYLNTSDFIKLGYSRRINRPGLGQLNPFIDITDSLNPHGGNPYLQPELVSSFELGYNKEWKKTSFTVNLFYRHANNIIRTFIVLDNSGVALVKPMNFGNAITYGVESMASVFAGEHYNFTASVSLFQQHIDGSNISADVANDFLSWYGKTIHNFMLSKNSKLQLVGNYNSPIATPQGTRIAVYNMDLGLQQKIWKGKGAVGLVLTDIFDTQKSGITALSPDFTYRRTFKVDSRAVLLTFAYSFRTRLKEELMQNKFSND